MKLHWSPRSPFVRKVVIFAREIGLFDQLTLQRSVVAMRQPNLPLMEENPLSKIPALVLDNGMVLPDSLLICDYLDTRHSGPRLIPQQGEARWQALRWHALANGLLDVLILWRNERDRPEEHQSVPISAGFKLKLEKTLALLESEHGAIAASPLSIGTITIGCMLGYLDFRFDEQNWRQQAPKLAVWHAEFAQRASYLATTPDDQ